jgi:cyanophycin synthetase
LTILKKNQKVSSSPLLINITGTNGKTTTAKIIERVLTYLNYSVGLASSVGIYIKGKRIKKHDCTGPKSYSYLKSKSSSVNILICENVLRHIRLGNFYPTLSDICLITNIAEDHIHQTKSHTVKEIAVIKSKLLNVNKQHGFIILNGDNRYTRNIGKKNRKKNIIYFSLSKGNSIHLLKENPESIYFLDHYSIYKKIRGEKFSSIIISDIRKIPLLYKLHSKFNIHNILAAVSVIDNLKGIHFSQDELQNAFLSVKPNFKEIPGRFNIFKFKNFTVILDDAHNPESYRQSFKSAQSLPHKRLVAILKASSTRSPGFIKKLGKIAAQKADFIYLKESFSKNSPKRRIFGGKIAQYLYEGIMSKNFPSSKIKIILDEEKAIYEAITRGQKGDLILIFAYRIDNVYRLIQKLKSGTF